MTESRIFDLLLKDDLNNPTDCTLAKLNKQHVDIISKKFTDVIYNSLKQNSQNNSNRGLILVPKKKYQQYWLFINNKL